MTNKPEASIVITTYNVQNTIGDTLDCVFDSAVNFSYEVIIVDDASDDATPDICQNYAARFIQLEHNGGPARARNRAIEVAIGDYIIFVDSDVTFPSDLLQRMMLRMKAEPDLAGVGSVSDPEPLNPCFYSRYFALQEYYLIASSAAANRFLGICTRCGILKRKLFDEFGGFDESHKKPSIEDYQFSLRIRDTNRIYWDKTFINRHYFPDSFWKILKRLHRNTKEMYWVMRNLKIKDTGPYVDDTRARLCIAISGLFFLAGFLLPWFFLPSILFMCSAILIKRNLLKLFHEKHGMIFTVRGWLIYIAVCFPLLTGLTAGIIESCQREPEIGNI
ncbi:glycosyltransferase [bacterium]|nr:glycosyltransferase [bacterium]